MTSSGIERNLKLTPYVVGMAYNSGKTIQYFFSSALAMDRFIENVELNREAIHVSLSNRFKIKFTIADEFCDVQLYRRTESRSFRINMNGVDIEWLGALSYDGQNLCKMS